MFVDIPIVSAKRRVDEGVRDIEGVRQWYGLTANLEQQLSQTSTNDVNVMFIHESIHEVDGLSLLNSVQHKQLKQKLQHIAASLILRRSFSSTAEFGGVSYVALP